MGGARLARQLPSAKPRAMMAAMNDTTPWAPHGAERTGFVERPGARIYYEVAGDGPALVFAHGLGGNHLSWWQQVPFFRERFTCVTFSHRGFAPSTVAGARPDPADFAGDLEALTAHLGIERFAIVGQSMGGWTALEFALRHPTRVAAMVLAATSGTLDPAQADPAKFAEWSNRAVAVNADLRMRAIHPALGAAMAKANPAMHHLYRGMDALATSLPKDDLRARIVKMRSRKLADVANLKVPTLFLTGSADMVFPSFAAPILARGFPDARHVSFEGAGHSAYFEVPDAFNQAVAGFLAR
jgi:3-oxoadipate enol-lactonase